jgi:hypothetical protein
MSISGRFILIGLILSSVAAWAGTCPDISGTYAPTVPVPGQAGNGDVILRQSGCEVMNETLVYSTLTLHVPILLDGLERLTAQMPDLHSKTYESNFMSDQGMEIHGKTYHDDVLVGTTSGLWSLDAQGNLHELYDFYDSTGKLLSERKNDYVKLNVPTCIDITGDYHTLCGSGDDLAPGVLHAVQKDCSSVELSLECAGAATLTDTWLLDGAAHPTSAGSRTGIAKPDQLDLIESFAAAPSISRVFTMDLKGKLHQKIRTLMNSEETGCEEMVYTKVNP